MESSVKDRLLEYLKFKRITKAEFQRSIDAANSYINNISKGVGGEKLERIRSKYPDLNIQWLLSGNGEMIVKTPPSNTNHIENSHNSGSITQVNNDYTSGYGRGSLEEIKNVVDGVTALKDLVELQKAVMSLKTKALKARIAATMEEKNRLLDEIIMDEKLD